MTPRETDKSSALVRIAHGADMPQPAPRAYSPGRGERGADPRPPIWTMRDVLAVGFRRKRAIVVSFVCVMGAAAAYLVSAPAAYESEMKILVRSGRTDQIVSAMRTPTTGRLTEVNVEQMNSEAQLIISKDLAQQVVETERLHEQAVDPGWRVQLLGLLGVKPIEQPEHERVRAAVLNFSSTLEVQPLLQSNVIRVSYASPDPERSRQVLNTLSRLYIEKHLDAHRATGALDFFNVEAQRYRAELDQAQKDLAELGRQQGVVDVGVEKLAAVETLAGLEETLGRMRGEMEAARRRIVTLEEEQKGAPPRMTTEIITNTELTARLRENLHTLELRKIELTQVFQSDYPQVQEVDRQIVATKRALDEQVRSPLSQETTDRDPTYDWVRGELAKARSELAALAATAEATAAAVKSYRNRTQRLNDVAQTQDRLEEYRQRAEENYLVYAQKREEARISEALDERRILNVSITDPPTTPIRPSGPSQTLVILGGLIVALVIGALSAALAELVDSSLSRPDDVENFLDTPVLASFPLSDNPLEGDA